MAVDMFLKMDPVKGESQDSAHKEEIDVLAWSWGASNSGTTHLGAGGGEGKANVQDLSVTKWADKASADLLKGCILGTHFNEAKLVCRKAGGSALEYITITMNEVLVTSISAGGSGGEDRLTENVTLNFGKVKFEYKEQKADGTAGPTSSYCRNIAANEDC
ncbi:MAG: hcp1 [Proteobacteria bacterium]|nr:hcp1 [Pseudomonadota bacterium]